MVSRRPIVVQDGYIADLAVGDTVDAGLVSTQVVAGSGFVGGGALSSDPRLDVALAPNPSGVIFVGDALGIDGAAQVIAETALASGSDASVLADAALASGNASLITGSAALASGNAALTIIPTLIKPPTVDQFVAAGAIVSGYAVGFDDTGSVQSVGVVTTDNTDPMVFGTPVVFESANSSTVTSTYDSTNNRVVVGYQDNGNSGYGTAVVGVLSGTSINFGTPVVFESAASYFISSTFDSTNSKVVTAYSDNGNGVYGTAIVGTVSGTSISFGTPAVYESAPTFYNSASFDSVNTRVVVAYQDVGNSFYGTSVIGTVSGTSISFGTPVTFETDTTSSIDTTYDAINDRVLVVYKDEGNLNHGTAILGAVSGTTISYGAPTVFNAGQSEYISASYNLASDCFVVGYQDDANSSYGTAVVGTISGTAVTFGSPTVFEPAEAAYISSIYDLVHDRTIFAYKDIGNSSYGTAVVGTVSGASISFATPTVFESAASDFISVTNDVAAQRTVIAYQDDGNSSYGTAVVADPLFTRVLTPTVNSYNNFLGISSSTVTSGELCTVLMPGSLYNYDSANLTTGAFYYLDPTTSGVTMSGAIASGWVGQQPWTSIGRAVTTSGLMILKSI